MSDDDEAARVRRAYARRARLGLDARYDQRRPANQFIYQSRERALTALLRDAGLLPLSGKRILDVGCGDGGVLLDLIRLGATPNSLSGVDLLTERIERARELTTGPRFEVVDARSLPFADRGFDLVLGFTLYSSLLDDAVRARVASEMSRVCAPNGAVLLYDFWINPFNRDARPLTRGEARALFPDWQASFRSVTLAPPLVRALAPLPGGRVACSLLEVLPFLRTHFLVALRPPPAGAPGPGPTLD